MPALTVAPAAEACQAIVALLNDGNPFALASPATYSRELIDPLEEIDGLRIDVESIDETQQERTLAIEDPTSHTLRVWIRAKITPTDTVDALALVVRQVFKLVNDFDSSDGRVRVWSADADPKDCPDKPSLRERQTFIAFLTLRVEVEATS